MGADRKTAEIRSEKGEAAMRKSVWVSVLAAGIAVIARGEEKKETYDQTVLKENAYFLELVSDVAAQGSCTLPDLFTDRYCKVIHCDDAIASIKIIDSSYTGGAHGSTHVTVCTLVKGRGAKPLTLEDIATPEQLPRLTALVREALKKRFGVKTDEELDRKTAHPEGKQVGPTPNFYYDAYRLHFIYNEYEIAAYSEGTIDIRVDWPRPSYAHAKTVAPAPPEEVEEKEPEKKEGPAQGSAPVLDSGEGKLMYAEAPQDMTLAEFAALHGMSERSLRQLNDWTNIQTLKKGDYLFVLKKK